MRIFLGNKKSLSTCLRPVRLIVITATAHLLQAAGGALKGKLVTTAVVELTGRHGGADDEIDVVVI